MKKLLLLLFLIPNLVMAEKWIPFVEWGEYERFYDEDSIKDNKDGTYSLSIKSINTESEQEIRKIDNDGFFVAKENQYYGVGSLMSEAIISCSPFKISVIKIYDYKHKDLTGFISPNQHSRPDSAYPFHYSDPRKYVEKKICEKNNATPTPTPTPTSTPKVSIDDAKKQCEDIGFKAGTEKFGECVLRLNR